MLDNDQILDDDDADDSPTISTAWGTFTMIPDTFLVHWAQVVGPAATMVYVQLCSFAGNKTHECWPRVKVLCQRTGYSESAVRRALSTLTDAGLLVSEPRYRSDGSRTSNAYFLPYPPDPTQPSTKEDPPLAPTPGHELDLQELYPSTYAVPSNDDIESGGSSNSSSPGAGDRGGTTTAFAVPVVQAASGGTPKAQGPEEDPDAGKLFEMVEQAGQLIWSPMHAEAWLGLLEITRDMDFIEEAFRSVATMGKTPNPRYIGAILRRCIQEGRRPGAGRRPDDGAVYGGTFEIEA